MTFSDMDNSASPIAATRIKRQLAEQAIAFAANGRWPDAAATIRRLLELGPDADA